MFLSVMFLIKAKIKNNQFCYEVDLDDSLHHTKKDLKMGHTLLLDYNEDNSRGWYLWTTYSI